MSIRAFRRKSNGQFSSGSGGLTIRPGSTEDQGGHQERATAKNKARIAKRLVVPTTSRASLAQAAAATKTRKAKSATAKNKKGRRL